MKKGLAIIILTIISTANLTANDILTLFSKWENASKIDRIHIGNELLEKGTEEGLLMGNTPTEEARPSSPRRASMT